jgi:uncharacterized membrane protein
VTDEARALERRCDYIDTVRGLYRRERNAGFVACLLGVLMLVWARFVTGVPALVLWAGLAVIAVGWALFAYSIFKRLAWVRANPMDAEN